MRKRASIVAMSSCGTGFSSGVPGSLSARAHGPRRHADRLICYGVAAEQPGIGDVLDMVHRATERCGVVTGLAGRGVDRCGADLWPRRVVPVNVPGHGVNVEALMGPRYPADSIQRVQVAEGHPQRHRGGRLPGPLQQPGLLVVVALPPRVAEEYADPGTARAALFAFLEGHSAENSQIRGQAIHAWGPSASRQHCLHLGSCGVFDEPVPRRHNPGLPDAGPRHGPTATRCPHRSSPTSTT